MRVLGHGIDLVEFESLKRLLAHAETDFIDEMFRVAEKARIPAGVNRLAHIAGRFAAKEAVTKALGTGMGDGVAFADVEIDSAEGGAPLVRLHGGAEKRAAEQGIAGWHLSISHGETAAIASAIAVDAPVNE